MNVNNRPAQPTNIIKLVSNHTELTIKRYTNFKYLIQLHYTTDVNELFSTTKHNKFFSFFAPCDGYKISSRFAFFAISDFIIVWDLFLGSSKYVFN
jgi:hypothetical protein